MHSTNHKTFISIVIPVYNSEETIGPLVDELVEKLRSKYELEIILVNDGSKDNSEKVCLGLYFKHKPLVHYIALAKNVGEHNAVMAGLNNVGGDYVLIMDDDFQNPISEVLKLISYAVENDYDVVYTYYEKKQHSVLRNLGSRFNDKIANVMLKKPKDLYLSSFKILNKFLVQEIIKYDLPYPYLDGLIVRTTDKIGRLQVDHHARTNGKSGYTVVKLCSLWSNMFTNFSILPLRISIFLGFLISFVSFIYGAYTVVEKIRNPDLPVGFAALTVSIATFAGVQLISLGMIGEYIGRIFLSQNKKPQFTIRKKYVSTHKQEFVSIN